MKMRVHIPVFVGLLALAACDDDPATRSDVGTALDSGDVELGGLDVRPDGSPGDAAEGDVAEEVGEDAEPDEDTSAGDAAVEAGEDGSADLPSEDVADATGDVPAEDLGVDAIEDGVADASSDPTVDLEPDLPPGECGNAALNAGEQCDDGNTTNLDGCDDECRYEQVQLLVDFNFIADTPSSPCGNDNRLNDALTNAVENSIEAQLGNAIQEGSLNIVLALLDLDDPEGADDASLSVGPVVSAPNLDADGPEAVAELDSWYDSVVGQLEGDEPIVQVTGILEDGTLSAGPLDLEIPLAGVAAPLADVQIALDVDSLFTSEPDPPPASFVAGFETFESMSGILCGDVPAEALAQIPAPQELLDFCDVEDYTACPGDVVDDCSSMLDVLQGGCTTQFLEFTTVVVIPTNPDGDGNYGTLFDVETLRVHLVDNYAPAN